MTKQEQIKEMGQIICERSKDGICLLDKTSCDGICGWTMQAETIYNAGYRKTFTSDLASDTQKAFKEGYSKGVDYGIEFGKVLLYKTRKETAKDIVSYMMNCITMYGCVTKYDCITIAKQYSVEVEE